MPSEIVVRTSVPPTKAPPSRVLHLTLRPCFTDDTALSVPLARDPAKSGNCHLRPDIFVQAL
jgi:hypothetical protein